MKFFLITKNPRYRTVFASKMTQKKIIFKTLETEKQILTELSGRGRKIIFLDHNYDAIHPENIVQITMSESTDNIVITFGSEIEKEKMLLLFRAGIRDLYTDPFMPEELIDQAISRKKESSKTKNTRSDTNTQTSKMTLDSERFVTPIGVSPAFKSLMMLVERVAESDATILITGESGTGKEVLAQYIHSLSHRGKKPFVPVNCGAIPENLLESELFGHVKGSFTGAFNDRKGRFEIASDGSIFLDEIGEMPLHLQVKLLRVLQEHEIQPVGSNEIIQINPRHIFATNKILEEEIKEGTFREDLFYRLNVIPIHLPPLRARIEDIEILSDFFIQKFNDRHKKSVDGISDDCLSKMKDYDWPGNIRELENTLERMVVIKSEGTLDAPDLPPKIQGLDIDPMAMLLGIEIPTTMQETKKEQKEEKNSPEDKPKNPFSIDWENTVIPENFDMKNFLEKVETGIIKNALHTTENNKNKAAQVLGVNRTTLIEKIKKKHLEI